MSKTWIAELPDRGVVAVTGPDAEKLLQGVLTNDMDLLASQSALHAGLLTPQGKILFDFIVSRAADGFLLDVDWCRFTQLGWYESGGKFLRAVELRDAA